MIYDLVKFIFPFLRSGVEVKRGVKFCHSTRTASRIWQKMGNGVSLFIIYDVTYDFEHQQVTLLVLLDFSNVFNTVQFDVLLAILRSINFSSKATE